MINSTDLADLLYIEGYEVDYDTGEVFSEDPDLPYSTLIILAALNKLDVGRDEEGLPIFYIRDLVITDLDSYCEQHPNDPQCKIYDV